MVRGWRLFPGGSGPTNVPLRSSGSRVALAAAGLTFLLTFEFFRAWAVSMPLFYDGNIHIAKGLMGLVAFSPFVVALIAALGFSRIRPPVRFLAVVAAGSRVGLQFVGPGMPRLLIVLVGLTAALCLLVAMAPRWETVLALVGALAADAVLLMVLQTESLVFRNGPGAAVAAVVMCAALVALLWTDAARYADRGSRSLTDALPPPRDSLLPWLGFGPVLALHLTLASLPAPIEVATGWNPAACRAIVAGAYLVGGTLALWGLGRTFNRRSARALPVLAGCIALGAAFLALFAGSADWAVVAAVLLPIGLLVGLSSLARLPGSPSPFASRFAAAAALTVGVGVPILYYIGFVYRYPLAPPWLLAATASIFAGLLALLAIFNRPVDQLSALTATGLAAAGAPRAAPVAEPSAIPRAWPAPETPPEAPTPVPVAHPDPQAPPGAATRRLRIRPVWAIGPIALVVAFLIAAPAVGGSRSTDRSALNGFPVRVASYNIFMGLGADVNMDLDRLAAEISLQKPDVIALEEVSRGWFTSGSVDLLPRIAARLGYSYRFFPAADQTWGNAILTNLPAADSVHGFLPQGVSAMRRGWGGEVLELGNGERMFFVVTHLYNPPKGHILRAQQAEELVKRTVSLAERYRLVDMTVVVGDLNAESDSKELASLRDVYTDVFGYLGSLPTYPSWKPVQRIDHVFASAGLKGSDPATFGGLASDHLGIAVTLRPAGGAGQNGAPISASQPAGG
jgi:endonuclease/exonuclease/phosphatase family metal-dependent hydrolase